MSKLLFRTIAIILTFSAFFYFAVAQHSRVANETLLREYLAAQDYYDKATNLSKLQNYGEKEEAQEKEWNEKALEGFLSIDQKISRGLSENDSLRFYVSFKIGELQHYFENFTQAVRYYKEAITFKEKSSLDDSLLFKPLLYAGIIFYNQNKFDTAITYFKKAEQIQAAYQNKLSEGERLYNILGVLFYERGNYKQAQNYFTKALALLPRSNPYYEELYVNYNINLGQIHLRLEEYDKANEIYVSLLPYKINLNEINHNIGSLNLALGAAENAISYFQKAAYQNNKIIRLQNSIGQAFFNLAQYDSALHYYQKAVSSYKKLGLNSDPIGYGLVLKNLGDYHLHFEKNEEAIRLYQDAIHQFYPAYTNKDIHSNPENYSGVFSYIHLFHTLNAKAYAWNNVYRQHKNIAAGIEELKTYQSGFKLIRYVERTYDSDEARLFLSKIKHAVHGKPIDIAYELYNATKDKQYLETLYYFDQQNKAAVLSLNRQLNSSSNELTTPEKQKEQALKAEITRLSIRAAQMQDNTQLTKINNTIRDHEIELGRLQEDKNKKLSTKEADIPSIQFLQEQLLDDKTAIISYHLSDEKLTRVVIKKSGLECFQRKLPKGFLERITQEIVRIKTPSDKPVSKSNVDFFSLLLSNISFPEIDQLIIIPDDILSYFSFESLQDKEGKYLVESVAVQYQYSTSLLKKNEIDFSRASTLSFAPFANKSTGDSFPSLPSSAEEVANIKGQLLINTQATKQAFLEKSKDFPVIHLATHAVANTSAEKLSYIAFVPANSNANLLYTQEIYNLQLSKTGLVILSACETAGGKLVEGEGILSLSRAFSYAGCPNTITSLWKAKDFSTAYLTKRIHSYLKKGISIAKSVQQAKKDYLADKTINPRLKQPYYWSHLIFTGNYSPTKNSNRFYFLIPSFFILLFLYLLKMPGKARHSISKYSN